MSAVLVTVAACSSAVEDKYLVLDGSKVCEVFTPAQIFEYGVGSVSAESNNTGRDKSFSNCVWKSISSVGGSRLLLVSFDTARLNDWIGDKNGTEPVSGYRASLFGDLISIAAGPESGVLTIDSRSAKKPIREIAEAAVARLKK